MVALFQVVQTVGKLPLRSNEDAGHKVGGEEPGSRDSSSFPQLPAPRLQVLWEASGHRASPVRFQPRATKWSSNRQNFLIVLLVFCVEDNKWIWSLPFFMFSLWFGFQDYLSPWHDFYFLVKHLVKLDGGFLWPIHFLSPGGYMV